MSDTYKRPSDYVRGELNRASCIRKAEDYHSAVLAALLSYGGDYGVLRSFLDKVKEVSKEVSWCLIEYDKSSDKLYYGIYHGKAAGKDLIKEVNKRIKNFYKNVMT